MQLTVITKYIFGKEWMMEQWRENIHPVSIIPYKACKAKLKLESFLETWILFELYR